MLYLACVPADTFLSEPLPGAGSTFWYNFFSPMGGLAYGQDTFVLLAFDRLQFETTQGPIVADLLPAKFTLSEMQAATEAIAMETYDKRNFRKKVLELGWLKETEEFRHGPHQPAKLYEVANRKLERLRAIRKRVVRTDG